jgi:hypothetical protein
MYLAPGNRVSDLLCNLPSELAAIAIAVTSNFSPLPSTGSMGSGHSINNLVMTQNLRCRPPKASPTNHYSRYSRSQVQPGNEDLEAPPPVVETGANYHLNKHKIPRPQRPKRHPPQQSQILPSISQPEQSFIPRSPWIESHLIQP